MSCNRFQWFARLCRTWQISALCLAIAPPVHGQVRPYVGFVYPAGGRQGTVFPIRAGGQGLDGVTDALVSGSGVTARITHYYWRLSNEELQLLNEQLRVLRSGMLSVDARALMNPDGLSEMMAESLTNSVAISNEETPATLKREDAAELITQIENRIHEHVNTPACASLASLVLIEVSIAADAEPGEREIRLVTLRGVSNPLAFHVGQVPEFSKKPMVTAAQQVLGKEAQALRKRLPGDDQERITLPCTVNGQIASGEVNRYLFEARQGQQLVFAALGRQLVPFIADAVPGWFQPVLTVYDADGREVAYNDDYRFKPDPTILYEVPKTGDYTVIIRDSLYRGREDFVYRLTMGELPFITSVFPSGGPVGSPVKPEFKGWNLQGSELIPLPPGDEPGIELLAVARDSFVSNRLPFARDTLPEDFDVEPNNSPLQAQPVTLPVIVNGRIDKPGDWDVFRFAGHSNEAVVLEVMARRLDSPLDSVIKLTDEAGNLLAFNDDHEDLAAGLNTHQADSYLAATLPGDGSYFVHIGDTARQGGEEFGYRLRISNPRPDFELRVVPASLNLRAKSSAALSIYAQRKDGFAGAIKVVLVNPPGGFQASPITMSPTQTVARLTVKTDLDSTPEPSTLQVGGSARIGNQAISHLAVPAEDRMQAFLWRQLVPAKDLKVLVFNPAFKPPPKRIPRPPHLARTSVATNRVLEANSNNVTNGAIGSNALASSTSAAVKPTFTKQQVAGRLKQLNRLFEAGMLTDEFYYEKVAECETAE